MKVYTAGPLGFSEAGRVFHQRIVSILHGLGDEVLDPWDFDSSRIDAVLKLPYGQDRKDAWARLNPEIGRKNQQMIDTADIIFAVLDGMDVDSGTAAEIGYGFARGRKVIGYRGDLRLAGDNEGSLVNLQVEYFILASGGSIITRIDDLPAALNRLR